MSSKSALVPGKPRRLPKKGLLFLFVRFAGLLLKIAGSLLLGIAVIGFFLMLVRIGPSLAGSIQSLDQQMAGFIFLISLGYLLIFPIVGLVGMVIAGVGFALGYIGTEAPVSKSMIGAEPSTDESA